MPIVTQQAISATPEPKGGLVARLETLRAGEAITVIGIGQTELGQMLSRAAATRPMLRLEFDNAATIAVAIDLILNDLADLVVARAPDWDDPDPVLKDFPRLRPGWRRAALRLAMTGRRPRFRQLAPETEFAHLLSVLPDLTLLADVSPSRSDRAAPIIAALDWCRRHGAAVVTLLSEAPAQDAPWDALLYNAFTVDASPVEPAVQRLIPLSAIASGSATERRMRAALRGAPDLAGLFEDEVTLQLGPLGPTPRVDLLWRDGKVVVELDGAEHERDPNYGADRHRDYELLVAGYFVLRLTNAEVQLDLDRSLEKVRRVVNLRRTSP